MVAYLTESKTIWKIISRNKFKIQGYFIEKSNNEIILRKTIYYSNQLTQNYLNIFQIFYFNNNQACFHLMPYIPAIHQYAYILWSH